MPSPIRRYSLGLPLGLLLACGATSTATTTPDAVALIAVDPANFQAVAPCGEGQAASTYVAELIDVSGRVAQDLGPYIGEFTVQTSPATACNRTVAFGEVVADREYLVRIKTYAGAVCTVERTSVTVPKVDGTCSNTLAEAPALAQPLSTIVCYGWRSNDVVASGEVAGAAGSANVADTTGTAGAAGSANVADTTAYNGTAGAGPTGGAGCEPYTHGCPATAIAYRTVSLRYCAPNPY